MANETRIVRYGDKTFTLDAGMTLEQAKAIMARHFPELADPQVDTKKEGEVTTYTFTKKAGRKGARRRGANAGVCRALSKAKPFRIPASLVQAVEYQLGLRGDGVNYDGVVVEDLAHESERVTQLRAQLAGLPSAQPVDGGILL